MRNTDNGTGSDAAGEASAPNRPASMPDSDNGFYREEEEYQNNNVAKRHRSSAALWKRFDPSDGDPSGDSSGSSSHQNSGDTSEKRSGEKFRIVDAMLLAAEGDDDGENNNMRSNKRRKLTLLDSSTIAEAPPNQKSSPVSSSSPAKKKRSKALKVLDPLTRIVDDSLKEVLVGEKTVEFHYRQLTTDPRFTMRDPSAQIKWMSWSLDGGTNILHCCALWNDASTANELLQRFGGAPARSALMESVDGDGRTPYEVAQLIGHSRVCEVLEVYGGDTSNYVYDIFYLDNDGLVKTRPSESDEGSGSDTIIDGPGGIMTAELTSGIGYWTPEGELILETAHDERRARSLSQETEGDIDSNCEEYGGNDYPDEYEFGEEPLDHYGGAPDPYAIPYANHINSCSNNNQYDDDDDDDDDLYNNKYIDDGEDDYVEYDWEQDLH